MIYILPVWTVICIGAGFWLRGESNYRRAMESQGIPVEAPVHKVEVVDEHIKLHEEID